MRRIHNRKRWSNHCKLPSGYPWRVIRSIDWQSILSIQLEGVSNLLLNEKESIVKLFHASSVGEGNSDKLSGSYCIAVVETVVGDGDYDWECVSDASRNPLSCSDMT